MLDLISISHKVTPAKIIERVIKCETNTKKGFCVKFICPINALSQNVADLLKTFISLCDIDKIGFISPVLIEFVSIINFM